MMDSAQETTPPNCVQEVLTVVEITPMGGGVSYLCCDDEGSIYRLVSESGLFCWSLYPCLLVGVTYIFNVFVDNEPPFSREKKIASWPPTLCTGRPVVDPVYLIAKQAKATIDEVFQSKVINGKYVNSPPECPEFGVWKITAPESEDTISPPSITIGPSHTDGRVTIAGYDLPYKSVMSIPATTDNKYVILGLSYPFTGTGQNIFDPPRCYIMVLGIKYGP